MLLSFFLGGIVVVPAPVEENPNQKMAEHLAAEGAIEARSVTDAISVLSVAVSVNVDAMCST